MTTADIPSPVRRVLFSFGQSNATTVAKAKGFEDANPQIALRNPASVIASAVRFSQGGVDDRIELPDPEFGPYRSISYRGVGQTNVRYLTFFNPVSTCIETADAQTYTTTYPGEVEVSSVVNARTFKTKLPWQVDPTGKVALTRKLTGVVHTIASITAVPGTEITAGENFDPPLQARERFTYTLAAAQNSVNTSTVTFYNQFGGNYDGGGLLEATFDGAIGDYPNTTINTYNVSTWEVTFTADGANAGKCFSREHGVYPGRKVRFVARSGTLPTDALTTLALSPSQDYYVTRLATPTDAAPETHYQFYISSTPGGPEIPFSAVSAVDAVFAMMPDGRGSCMYGMNLRCLTGANVGQVRALSTVTHSGGLWTCNVQTPFANTPQLDDTFSIEPPDVNGVAVPWAQWAYFLPLCQFNGQEKGLPAKVPLTITPQGVGLPAVFLANDAGAAITAAAPFYDGCPVRLYRKVYSDFAGTLSGETWPAALSEGKTYYVVGSDETTGQFNLASTYDGAAIEMTGAASLHWIQMAETWVDKSNPAPPGFNHENMRCVPVRVQPYAGPTVAITPASPRVAYHCGAAQRLAEALGETIYVVDLSAGATTLSQTVITPAGISEGVGWHDPNEMTHWAP